MLWPDLQCCSFAGKLFGSMTDFPHCVLHPATSEHFVSIQAKSGLFIAVAAGPGLKVQEGGGGGGDRSMELWGDKTGF